MQVFSFYYKFGSSSPGDDQTKRYGTILVIFSACMILGAGITHFFIPEVQEKAKKGSIFAGKAKSKSILVNSCHSESPQANRS